MKATTILGTLILCMLLGATAGCAKKEEAPKIADPDAAKRELDELNKARKKEWGK